MQQVRESRGYSQGELAKLVSIDRTSVNKIERGTRGDVSLSQLFKFAHALRISPLYLLTPSEADGSPVDLVPGESPMAPAAARAWIRGAALPGADPVDYFLDLPRDEQRLVLQGMVGRRRSEASPLVVAAAGGWPQIEVTDELLDQAVQALVSAKEER